MNTLSTTANINGFPSIFQDISPRFAVNNPANMQVSRYLAQAEEDGGITLNGLHRLARSIGVNNPENTSHKIDVIHAIQKATHQPTCFRAETSNLCTREDCSWQVECKKLVAEWYR